MPTACVVGAFTGRIITRKAARPQGTAKIAGRTMVIQRTIGARGSACLLVRPITLFLTIKPAQYE